MVLVLKTERTRLEFKEKKNFFHLLFFFFGFLQVVFEREKGGSCRQFIRKVIFPVTAATFVQNESRWPLFLPKRRAGRFITVIVHDDCLTDSCLNAAMNACLAAY